MDGRSEGSTGMKRDLQALETDSFDVAVIGGGVDGGAIAWDLALRGAKVALVEKGDFGGATSAGTYKIVHGGLRYLQHLDFPRIAESVQEQHLFRKIAPHLVHPLPFLIPCYGYGMKGREILNMAMSVYDLLSRKRNEGMDESHLLPNHKMLSTAECLRLAPGISQRGLRGGALYYDCQMFHSDRLTFLFVQGAAEEGATVVNYAEAVGFESEGGALRSMRVRDRFSGREVSVRAEVFINAAGPWTGGIERLAAGGAIEGQVSRGGVYSKGIQLIVPQLTAGVAVAVQSEHRDRGTIFRRGGRSYFIVPWQGFSLLGTADALYTGDPDGYRITDEEIALLLEELKTAYASPVIDREHVLAAFGGLRPVDRIVHELVSRGGGAEFGSVEAARRDRIEWSAGNLLTVEGIKYTTVRDVAEKVGDRVAKRLSRSGALAPCRTRERVLPGGEVGGFTGFLQRATEEFSGVASPEVIRYLATTYGTRYRAIADRIRRKPELGTPFQGAKVTPAELLCAAESEMVCTLTDVVMRRTALGVTGLVPEAELRRAGELVGAALGWEPRRLDEELHHLRAALLRGHHLHSPPRHAAAPR